MRAVLSPLLPSNPRCPRVITISHPCVRCICRYLRPHGCALFSSDADPQEARLHVLWTDYSQSWSQDARLQASPSRHHQCDRLKLWMRLEAGHAPERRLYVAMNGANTG